MNMKRYYTTPEVDMMILAGRLMDTLTQSIGTDDGDNMVTYSPAHKGN